MSFQEGKLMNLADGKVVYDDLRSRNDELKSAIGDITGNQIYNNWVGPKKYIALNDSTADINNPATSSGNCQCMVISASEGDSFHITATGGNASRAYGFVASATYSTPYAVLGAAPASTSFSETDVICPANTAYLVVNDTTYAGKIYKNELVKNDIENIKSALSLVEEMGLLAQAPDITWEQGGIGSETGVPSGSSSSSYSKRIRSANYVYNPTGCLMVITVPDGFKMYLHKYSGEDASTFISSDGWKNQGKYIVAGDNNYYRFTASYEPEGTIDPSAGSEIGISIVYKTSSVIDPAFLLDIKSLYDNVLPQVCSSVMDVFDITDLFDIDDLTAGYYYSGTSNKFNPVADSGSIYNETPIDLSGYRGNKLMIITDYTSIGTRQFGFGDDSGNVATAYTISDVNIKSVNGLYTFICDVTGPYMYFSWRKKASIIKAYLINVGESSGSSGGIKYVSVNGSDNGTGELSSPFATVNKALESGADVVCISAGTYEQTIDLSKCVGQSISLRNITTNGKVVFKAPGCVISNMESAVSGYTKVYQCAVTKEIPDGLKWIWQDGVPDESTLITDAERMPQERGMAYRLMDTKIIRCASTVLADALAEIENDSGYKWFYDAENTTMYFSRPSAISENPICCGDGINLFSNGSRKLTLSAYSIDTKYMAFNVSNLSGASVYDCKSAYVRGRGCFVYSKCISGLFVRCEAVGCQTGINGDGFNAHSDNTGDPFSKQTVVTLMDCWSHDNYDDGYSDHERSEITIIGGLYEYNGKGGVVPSYGSHCSCYNAVARNNYNGFYYTGVAEQAEGGKYGQILCVGCYSEGNTDNSGFKVGGAGNKAILIDCRSVNNVIGYYCDSVSFMELVDCRSYGNTTIKQDSGNHITIKNTDLVT